MTKIKNITNRAEIEARIAELLTAHECTGYQEDIYLYIDDNGAGRVELYTNVGGNSWLDDDHVAAYAMKADYDDKIDRLIMWCDDATELADLLAVTVPETDEDGDEIDAAEYLRDVVRAGEIDIDAAWDHYKAETAGDVAEQAATIVDTWIEEEATQDEEEAYYDALEARSNW